MVRQTVTTALDLAGHHPEVMLPCPMCAASVRGANLEQHVHKVHAADLGKAMRWRGSDRAIQVPAGVLLALSIPSLALVIGFGGELTRLLLLLPTALLTAGLAGLMLSMIDRLQAELVLEGDELRLRYALGLMHKRFQLPPQRVEVGSLVASHSGVGVNPADHQTPEHDVRIGTFVCLESQGKALTVASRSGTGWAKHWDSSGYTRVGKRRHCDIVVSAEALVSIEYWLAARGLLRLIQR